MSNQRDQLSLRQCCPGSFLGPAILLFSVVVMLHVLGPGDDTHLKHHTGGTLAGKN